MGSLTGALCVWLRIKQNIWNWPIGITNNISTSSFFYKSGLFADAGLQFVYIAIAIYGWWNWLHGGLQHGELEVKTVLLPASWISGHGRRSDRDSLLGLRRFTPSTVPFADGLTVALFLTAQFMMSKKIVQNWWFWIVGDVLVIGLYIYKQLYLTSALYAFFLAMCIAGFAGVAEGIKTGLRWQR